MHFQKVLQSFYRIYLPDLILPVQRYLYFTRYFVVVSEKVSNWTYFHHKLIHLKISKSYSKQDHCEYSYKKEKYSFNFIKKYNFYNFQSIDQSHINEGCSFFPSCIIRKLSNQISSNFWYYGLSYFISKEVISHFDGEATDMCSCFKARGLLASFFKG